MAAYRFGRCRLNVAARELLVDGEIVHVEPQVFDVLAYLVTNRQRVVGKAELLDSVWGSQFVAESALTSRIKSARRAIGDDGEAQQYIRTYRGSGYRFVGAVEVDDVDATADARGVAARPSGALPAARSRLVGRLADLAALDELLGNHRVVTICGPAGAGESTLAIEVARRRRPTATADSTSAGQAPAEVIFVDLAPVRAAAGVARAVAEAAGVEGATDPSGIAARRSTSSVRSGGTPSRCFASGHARRPGGFSPRVTLRSRSCAIGSMGFRSPSNSPPHSCGTSR